MRVGPSLCAWLLIVSGAWGAFPLDPYACRPGAPSFPLAAQLPDGRILRGGSPICRPSPRDTFHVILQGRTLRPPETAFLVVAGDTGRPHRAGWLFPAALPAAITPYRFGPEEPGRPWEFLVGRDTVHPYGLGAIATLVRDHGKARSYLRWREAGTFGLFAGVVLGSGIIYFGNLLADEPGRVDDEEARERTRAWSLTLGLGLAASGTILFARTRDNHRRALDAYNADPH